MPVTAGSAPRFRDFRTVSSPMPAAGSAIMDFINTIFSDQWLHNCLQARDILWPFRACTTSRQEPDGAVWLRFRNISKKSEEDDTESGIDAHRECIAEIHRLVQEKKIVERETAILTRTNKDLTKLAAALDELGLTYIHESSNSVLQHRSIKPLMTFLSYISAWDFNDLIKFLRSDYLLMPAREMKRVLLAYKAAILEESQQTIWARITRDLPDSASLQRTAATIEKCSQLDLFNLCKTVFEDFAVSRLFPLENDVKNMHHFLEIVAVFSEQRSYLNTPAGFVQYCHEHEAEEILQQVGLNEVDALQLLTIHKAKGKEFENVFVFWQASSEAGNFKHEMQSYLRYETNFRKIEQYALTFNYDKVLQKCSHKALYEGQCKRDDIEELNTFYVALTRARSNLGIYMSFQKKEGLQKWIEEIKPEEISIAKLFLLTLYRHLAEKNLLLEDNDMGAYASWGEIARSQKLSSEVTENDYAFIAPYLDSTRSKYYQRREKLEDEEYINYKTVYLKKRSADRGNVVHYYLSHIKWADSTQLQLAAQYTRAFYGTLLPVNEIRQLLDATNTFIREHDDLFSLQKWDNVFTEQTLFAKDGRELRIDRLLVHESKKEVLIIDFKTGEALDDGQLRDYVSTVQSLSFVKAGGYQVRGVFMEIKV